MAMCSCEILLSSKIKFSDIFFLSFKKNLKISTLTYR